MPASYRFEPEALADYLTALRYHATEVDDPEVANRFATAVENAIANICEAPERWRVVSSSATRRYVLQQFSYVIYYRFDSAKKLVTIYAVMHTSRRPGYWQRR